MAEIARSFNIGFPIEVDSAGAWERVITAFGSEEPLILVLRQGGIRVILSGEAVVRWTGELPAWVKQPHGHV